MLENFNAELIQKIAIKKEYRTLKSAIKDKARMGYNYSYYIIYNEGTINLLRERGFKVEKYYGSSYKISW